MTVIVLDMQSVLYARLLERAMLQELDNHQIIISKTPNLTKDICEIHKPRVVIMEVTGYSPISFLNLLRCTRAQEYLTSGRFNVSETAALCGFENLSYFSRTYKKHMGMLPSSKQ